MEKIEVPKTGSGDMFDPIRPDFSEVEKEGKRIMKYEVIEEKKDSFIVLVEYE